MQKTLTDLFPNALQDATTITLTKADLGLTSPNNNADQFLAAVAIKAKAVMPQSQFDADYDQNLYVADGFNSFIVKNDGTTDVQFEVRQIVFNLAKPDVTTLNPEEY